MQGQADDGGKEGAGAQPPSAAVASARRERVRRAALSLARSLKPRREDMVATADGRGAGGGIGWGTESAAAPAAVREPTPHSGEEEARAAEERPTKSPTPSTVRYSTPSLLGGGACGRAAAAAPAASACLLVARRCREHPGELFVARVHHASSLLIVRELTRIWRRESRIAKRVSRCVSFTAEGGTPWAHARPFHRSAPSSVTRVASPDCLRCRWLPARPRCRRG